MDDQPNDELNLLNRKVEMLLNEYQKLKAEVVELKVEIKGLKINLKDKEDELKDIERKYERLKLTGALMGEGGNARESKERIGELVREIDRCIALLNR
jgi:predicted  nucleic acid-binding Zn-ribbon protein